MWRRTGPSLIWTRLARRVAWVGEIRNTYRILIGKLERRRRLGIPWCMMGDIYWNLILCTGYIWLWIGTSGGLLWTCWWTFGLTKIRETWLAERLLAFPCSSGSSSVFWKSRDQVDLFNSINSIALFSFRFPTIHPFNSSRNLCLILKSSLYINLLVLRVLIVVLFNDAVTVAKFELHSWERNENVWGITGVILTGENRSDRR